MRTGKTLLDGDSMSDADADADADGDDLFTVKRIEYPSAPLDKASEADLNAPSKRSLRKIKADRKSKVRHTSHVTRHTSHITHHTSHVTHHTSHVTRHTSHVTRHTSHVTRHTSHVTRHTSHVTRHTRRAEPLHIRRRGQPSETVRTSRHPRHEDGAQCAPTPL
jgi:hypothetical protein